MIASDIKGEFGDCRYWGRVSTTPGGRGISHRERDLATGGRKVVSTPAKELERAQMPGAGIAQSEEQGS
jgi:hypothetical protein